MDQTYESQCDERELKRWYRRTFYALNAPLIALIPVIACWVGHWCSSICGSFTICLILIVELEVVFLFHWRATQRLLARTGTFEQTTTIHLTDTLMEISCGANATQMEYRTFFDYLLQRKFIVLRQSPTAGMAIIRRDRLPDNGEELLRCLNANGVRKFCFWSLRRWWLVLLVVVICIGLSAWRTRWQERENCRICESSLGQLAEWVLDYDRWYGKNEGEEALLPETLQEIDKDWVVWCCRNTFDQYRYVPYRRRLDADSPTAQYTPLLVDSIGAHRQPGHARIRLTLIAFEDTHVSCEENLNCYMDIYNRYGHLQSPEDAEFLRKYCEQWDTSPTTSY